MSVSYVSGLLNLSCLPVPVSGYLIPCQTCKIIFDIDSQSNGRRGQRKNGGNLLVEQVVAMDKKMITRVTNGNPLEILQLVYHFIPWSTKSTVSISRIAPFSLCLFCPWLCLSISIISLLDLEASIYIG